MYYQRKPTEKESKRRPSKLSYLFLIKIGFTQDLQVINECPKSPVDFESTYDGFRSLTKYSKLFVNHLFIHYRGMANKDVYEEEKYKGWGQVFKNVIVDNKDYIHSHNNEAPPSI